MPRVTVIMPVFNAEQYLAEAIESILTQTFTDFDLLIVDDCSTDGSAEIIHSFERRDNRIHSFRLGQNHGRVSYPRSFGIAKASGEFAALMDADDISRPERLQKQVGFLEANPDVGAVGTYATVVDERLRPIGAMHPPRHHAATVIHFYIGRPVLDPTVMFRRNLMNAGDLATWKMNLLARLLGRTRFANLPEELYVYRKHEVSFSATRRDDWIQNRVSDLDRYLGITSNASVATYRRLHWREKLSWRERRSAKRQLIRLIDSMIAAQWAEPKDRPLILAEVNQLLEETSPRIWQMFCHWRRHRFGYDNKDGDAGVN